MAHRIVRDLLIEQIRKSLSQTELINTNDRADDKGAFYKPAFQYGGAAGRRRIDAFTGKVAYLLALNGSDMNAGKSNNRLPLELLKSTAAVIRCRRVVR